MAVRTWATSLALAFVPILLAQVTTDDWIDPDTTVRSTRSLIKGNNVDYTLVMSDEFNTDGRYFRDGEDPKWTAMENAPYVNSQTNYYSENNAFTKDGALRILFENKATGTKDFTSAMIQSWNKFCYTGGILEAAVIFPGRGDTSGLWPGFWTMGNIGRPNFQNANEGLWPFHFDQCPVGAEDQFASSWGWQTINQCMKNDPQLGSCIRESDVGKCDAIGDYGLNPNQGRGSNEFDLFEVVPGSSCHEYKNSGANGCPTISAQEKEWLKICWPVIGSSFGQAPGVPVWPKDADQRPSTCVPDIAKGEWYETITPNSSQVPFKVPPAYGPNATLNKWYGATQWKKATVLNEATYLAGKAALFTKQKIPGLGSAASMMAKMSGQTTPVMSSDWLSAEIQIGLDAFEKPLNLNQGQYKKIRMEWEPPSKPGAGDGYLMFAWDGIERYRVNGTLLRDKRISFDGVFAGILKARDIPHEPNTIVINVDSSTFWGDIPSCSSCAQQCTQNNPAWLRFCQNLPAQMSIDWVRVYQDPKRINVGCNGVKSATATNYSHPTEGWIRGHRDKYFMKFTTGVAPLQDNFLKAVKTGGAYCTNATCGNGTCINQTCSCAYGWTGPSCLVKATLQQRTCRKLSENIKKMPHAIEGRCKMPTWQDNNFVELERVAGGVCELLQKWFQALHLKKKTMSVQQFAALAGNNLSDSSSSNASQRLLDLMDFSSRCDMIKWNMSFGSCDVKERAMAALGWWNTMVEDDPHLQRLFGVDVQANVGCCNLPGANILYMCDDIWVAPAIRLAVILLVFIANCIFSTCCHYQWKNEEYREGQKRSGNFGQDRVQDSDGDVIQPASVAPWQTADVAALFPYLGKRFGFQEDSVANQAEHFKALRESQEATGGDLFTLHKQLMDSYVGWVRHIADDDRFEPSEGTALLEIALYLLVWGEAGNARFMPHFIDLVTYMAVLCEEYASPSCGGRESFLRRVIEPMYAVIFSETNVGLNEKGRPVVKYATITPSDVSNYDDWNEAFSSVDRLNTMVLKDRSCMWQTVMNKPENAWQTLLQMDWEKSLHGMKTHYEAHSWIGCIAPYSRIIFLHAFGTMVTMSFAYKAITAHHHYDLLKAAGLAAPFCLALDLFAANFLFKTSDPYFPSTGSFIFRKTIQVIQILLVLGIPICTFLWYLFQPNSRAAQVVHIIVSCIFIVYELTPKNLYRFCQMDEARYCFRPCAMILLVIFWGILCFTKFYFDFSVTLNVWWAVQDQYHLLNGWWFPLGLTWGALSYVIFQYALGIPIFYSIYCVTGFFVVNLSAVFGAVRGWFAFGTCSQVRLMRRMPGRFCKNVFSDAETPDGEEFADLPAEQRQKFARAWAAILDDLHQNDLISSEERQRMITDEEDDDSESMPSIFKGWCCCCFLAKPHCACNCYQMDDGILPKNEEAKRRLRAFARSMHMKIPEPMASIPCFTVLIPHYGETVLETEQSLGEEFRFGERHATKADYLEHFFDDEFTNFQQRMREGGSKQSAEFEREMWASRRTQTLWRTVEGMNKYRTALKILQESGQDGCDPKRYQLLIAVQQYATLPATGECSVESVERLLQAFPDVSIAYVQSEASDENPKEFKHFSCLTDGRQEKLEDGRRKPRFRVRLPGVPILGHGKSDNQNCALIFARGEFVQTIDCNQEGYLEASFMIPNVLAEFYNDDRPCGANDRRPGILGFREHIFSTVGAIGSFAASSEFIFGTLMQRMMSWPFDVRMHYGHPDVLDKLQMMHQGGVSKATRSLNLSEDIFAGLDLTLNGGHTKYLEYFHVGKGRDMGFGAVMSFWSKIAMGAAEVTCTRQHLRISRSLSIGRLLSFYYFHMGGWLQHVMLRMVVEGWAFMALVTALMDDHGVGYGLNVNNGMGRQLWQTFDSLAEADGNDGFARLGARMLMSCFGWVYLLFQATYFLPLWLEVFVEDGSCAACWAVGSQLFRGSFLFNAFQSKVIDHYFCQEIRYGGAKYEATGRGIGTERIGFVDLYKRYAVSAHYTGMEVFMFAIAALVASRGLMMTWPWIICVVIILLSWCYAPYIFNPYQFTRKAARKDFRHLCDWLTSRDATSNWMNWCSDVNSYAFHGRPWVSILPSASLAMLFTYIVIMDIKVRTLQLTGELLWKFPNAPHWGTVLLSIPWILPSLVTVIITVPFAIYEACKRKDKDYAQNVGIHVNRYALVYLIATLVEIPFVVRAGLGVHASGTFIVFVVIKYFWVRTSLQFCDFAFPPMLELLKNAPDKGWCMSFVIHMVVRLVLGYRYIRDVYLTLVLNLPLLIIAHIPCVDNIHTMFLFSVYTWKEQNGEEEEVEEEAEESGGDDESDDEAALPLTKREYY